MKTATQNKYSIETSKGFFSSRSLAEVAEWQCRHQGAHATLVIKCGTSRTEIDVSDIDFDDVESAEQSLRVAMCDEAQGW